MIVIATLPPIVPFAADTEDALGIVGSVTLPETVKFAGKRDFPGSVTTMCNSDRLYAKLVPTGRWVIVRIPRFCTLQNVIRFVRRLIL